MGFFHTVVEGQTLDSLALRYGIPADTIWGHPENQDLHSSNPARDLSADDRVWIPTDSTERPIVLRRSLGRALSPPGEIGGAGRALSVPLRTGRSHRLIVPQYSHVEVQWLDHRAEPLAGWDFRARDGAYDQSGTLDHAGMMRVRIPAGARRLEVQLLETNVAPLQDFVRRGIPAIDVGLPPPRALIRFDVVLDLGALGRAQDDQGVVQRLASLAYFDNHIDDASTFDIQTLQNDAVLWRRLERARARFRRDQGFQESTDELSSDERQRLDEVFSSTMPVFAGGHAQQNLPLMRAPDECAIRLRREPGAINVVRRPSATQEVGICGLGMYMRSPDMPNEYPITNIVDNLDWVCVALRNERGVLNRGLQARRYLERLSELGVNITCFDWRPRRETWRDGPPQRHRDRRQGLEATIAHAASVGATAFGLNIEEGFVIRPPDPQAGRLDLASMYRYVDRAREVCREHHISLGLIYFGRVVPSATPELLRRFAWIMPMTLARNQAAQNAGDRYFSGSMEGYFRAGGRVFSMSVAMTRVPEGRRPVRRTRTEFRDHIRHVPSSVDSVCVWPWGSSGGTRDRDSQALMSQRNARSRLGFLRDLRTWWEER